MRSKRFVLVAILCCLLSGAIVLSAGPSGAGPEAIYRNFMPAIMKLRPFKPYLVKDVNPQTPSSFMICNAALDEAMICSARDADHGYELWKSNGLRGGASFLKDVALGYDSYAAKWPSSTIRLNDSVLFAASTGEDELWRTDGTEAGTVKVTDAFFRIGGGNELDDPAPFTVAGDILYFIAYETTNGTALWRSDGTTAGTYLLKKNPNNFYSAGISHMTPVGDRLYFLAEGEFYQHLWESDGTAAGTKLVSALGPAQVTDFAALDNFFLLNMRETDQEPYALWRSDGTTAGTKEVSDYSPFSDIWVWELEALDSTAVFTFAKADSEGWGVGRSDGTEEGTALFSKSDAGGERPISLTVAGNQAFFFVEGGPQESNALWRTDGTETGTKKLDTFSKADNQFCPATFFAWGSKVFFAADDGQHGCELWVSDGTKAGTIMLGDIARDSRESNPQFGVIFKNHLYFSAADTSQDTELWRTDGTAEGTVLADDVLDHPSQSSHPNHLTAQPQGIYFSARVGGEQVLWQSDGTENGTEPIRWFGSDSIDSPFASGAWVMAGNRLFFVAHNAVWQSNGTEAGTVQLSGPEECDLPKFLTVLGGKVYFFAEARGTWLCEAGQPHKKIKSLGGDHVDEVVSVDSVLYFKIEGKLGMSNGTAAGTKVYSAPGLTNGPNFKLAVVGDTVFFNGCDGPAHGCELWKLKGLQGTPTLVMDIEPGGVSSNPSNIYAAGNEVVFMADMAPYGPLLWRSDGTEAGTVPIAQVSMCSGTGSNGLSAAMVGDLFYFPGFDTANGCELWATDGTSAGTQIVRDILKGQNHSYPGRLTAAGRHLIFTANDGKYGRKLWASDGSRTGTFRLDGSYGHPEYLTVSGNRLFFNADDGVQGNVELWAILIEGN